MRSRPAATWQAQHSTAHPAGPAQLSTPSSSTGPAAGSAQLGRPSSSTAGPAHLAVIHMAHDGDHRRPRHQVLKVLLIDPLCSSGWGGAGPSALPSASSQISAAMWACRLRRSSSSTQPWHAVGQQRLHCWGELLLWAPPIHPTAVETPCCEPQPRPTEQEPTDLPSWPRPRAGTRPGPAHPRRSPAANGAVLDTVNITADVHFNHTCIRQQLVPAQHIYHDPAQPETSAQPTGCTTAHQAPHMAHCPDGVSTGLAQRHTPKVPKAVPAPGPPP